MIRGLYRRGQVWWYRFQRDGRRVQVSLETSNEKEAVLKALSLRESVEQQESGSWDDEVATYIASKRRQGTLSRVYAESRGYVLRAFARDCEITAPRQVTHAVLQRWYDGMAGRNPHTAAHYVAHVSRFLKHLHADGKLRENPAKRVKVRKLMTSVRKDFVPAQAVTRIIEDATDDGLRFILLCGFDAGLRKNEIIEARPDWFDLKRGCLTVQKTATFEPKDRDERTIPLTGRFKEFLARYGRPSPFMLAPERKHGRGRYRYDFKKSFAAHMKAMGFQHITPHDMRRSFASNLVIAGVSVFKVATWLGDDVTVVQNHYAHLLPVDSDIERGVHAGKKKR